MTRAAKIKRYAVAIQKEIVSCPNEQSFDEGDCIWISGSPSDIPDLLYSHDVPEDLHEEVVDLLRCPECDSPFEMWQDVGVKADFENAHEAIIERAMRKHGKKLFEFWGHLHKFPLLGAAHPFGKQILRHIRESPKTMVPRSGWFRARENKEHGFGPAPSEHVSDQRYNTSGQSRWYFADSAEAAVAEVSQKGAAWVQAFDAGALDGLLDLRAWRADDERALTEDGDYRCPHNLLVVALVYGDLLTQRHAGDDEARRWKPEYLVSRFIAEAATAAGFNGIMCQSVRYPGENLVVFDPDWTPKVVGDPTFLSLHEGALQTRDNCFVVQGQSLIVPDLSFEQPINRGEEQPPAS